MKLFSTATFSGLMTMATVFIQVASSSPLLQAPHYQGLEIVKRKTAPQPCNECKKGLVCVKEHTSLDSSREDDYMIDCRVPMGATCQKGIVCADGFYCGPSGKCDGHKGTPLGSACELQTCDHGLYCDHSKKCLKMG